MLPLANVLQPLIDAFDSIIVFFHDSAGLSWGLSIIALTLVVRAALLPLAFKQFHSMQALQRHAPELKAIQERYRNDKQRQQQETMRFYQENKVNPFASCLPLLLQMPVFIALFYMLRADLRVDICGQSARPCGDAAAWFFIPDLTDKATGGVLAVLLVLYVGSQLISSLLMAVTADKTQRLIFIALPFIFVPFITSFPAGLLVYWITTNLWTVGQQWVIRKSAGYGGWAANQLPEGMPAPQSLSSAFSSARGEARSADGSGGAPQPTKKEAASAGKSEQGRPTATAPPPPPRKKKKRSGRRR